MFCRNCGKEISDTATFCPYCGANIGNVSAKAEPSPVFLNMGKWIKTFFSKQVVANLDVVAKDTSLTGLIGLLFECCVAAMFVAIVPVKAASSIVGLFGGSSFGDSFVSFLVGLFKQYIFVALMLASLFGMLHIVLAVNHKKASPKQTLNLMFYSLLPVSFVLAGGFVLILLSLPLGLFVVVALSITASLMSIILLYKGFMKLDSFELDPFYSFTLFSTLLALVVFIILTIDISMGVASAVSNASRGLSGLLGNLF